MALKASAEGFVVEDLAVGVGTALGAVTGINTLPVTAAGSCTGQAGPTVAVGCALIRTLASLDIGVSNKASGTDTLEGAWHIGALGRRMTYRVLALVDVSASSWGADEAYVADTVAIGADFAGTTVLLLVTARLTRAVNTYFALQTISVRMAHLHTD